MKRIVIFLFLLFVLFILTACADTSEKLVGVWQVRKFPDIQIEFAEDGRFYDYFDGEITNHGEYEISDSTLTIEYLEQCFGNECTIVYDFTLEGNTLTKSDEFGGVFVYQKIE